MINKDSYRQHISAQFNDELEMVKNHVLEMGGVVEQNLQSAIDSLVRADSGLAVELIAADKKVNALEVAIDDECARILARRQPAASDLRLVMAVIRVTTDLERIGDEATKIARQAVRTSEDGHSPSNYVELRTIGQRVSTMLRNALDAFARLDVQQAVDIVKHDAVVDREYASVMRSLVTFMMEDPRTIGVVLNEMWALRSLERVGDHATNVAEQVIFLVKGLDVRHVGVEQIMSQLESGGDVR